MPNPADEVNRVVRTVIEATDPALRPVAKLRRFVVKRVELPGTRPGASRGKPAAKPGGRRASGQSRTGTANAGK